MDITLNFSDELTINVHGCDQNVIKKYADINSAEIKTFLTESGISFYICEFPIGKNTIKLFT